MKIGLIYCAYNTEEYLFDSLKPFREDPRFIISAVSVPFLEYRDQDIKVDDTTEKLRKYKESGAIKYLVDSPKYIKEHEARNLALNELKKDKVDYILLCDSDEVYKKEDLDKIVDYITEDKESIWWRICLKNFVFDEETYLEEPFCPPRIFRTKTEDLSHPSFYFDNDISYLDKSGQRISYEKLKNDTIPQGWVWVDHYTWPDNERGKEKQKYQMSHFGLCSFSWDEKKGVTFNEEYYKLRGEEIPKTREL